MVTEYIGKTLASHLISFVKEKYKDNRYKKKIDEIFNKEFSGLSQNLIVLCSDKTFANQMFQLAKGQTIDAKKLVDQGEKISNDKSYNFSRGQIIEYLKDFAIKLNNCFEQIAPEPSKIPSAFSNFFHSLEILSATVPQAYNELGPTHPPMQRPRRAEHFTGRKKELDKLINDLQPGKVVTLCGPGGIGKSALAAKAIWQLAQGSAPPKKFSDGIISHDFYTTPQAELALEHIALSLGEEPKPSAGLAAQRALSGRKVLLLLDGTEDADDLRKVLDVAGSCGVLVTSRKRSDAVDQPQDIETLPMPESIKLLQLWGKLQVQDNEAAHHICELLGGLPLAIRLAGRYMSQTGENAADFLAWLAATPLAALDHGVHREESVPLLLDRSLQQLSESARQVLFLSGLLAFSPFSQEVAAAALAMPIKIVKSSLGQLVLFGLLTKPESLKTYEVSHALIHTYISHEKLLEPSVKERLISYYTALAKEQCQKGKGGHARLDIEKAHLMQVLTICKDESHQRAVIDFVSAIDSYLDLSGYWLDRRLVLKAGVKAAQQQQSQDSEGVLLGSLGNASFALGQVEKAIEYHEQAQVIAREIGDRRGEGTWLGNLGTAYRGLGQVEKAIEYYEHALVIAREIGDRRGEGTWLNNLGSACNDLGQVENAIKYHEQALVIAREVGDRSGEGNCLDDLGTAYSALSQVEKAIEYYEHALVIAREIGNRHRESTLLGNLGSAYRALGRVEKAIEYHEQTLVIAREIGDRPGEGNCLDNLGSAYSVLGQVEKAIEYHEQALAIACEIENRRGEGNCLHNLGSVYSALGQVGKAIEYYEQALVIAREIGNRHGESTLLGNLGGACDDLGQVEKAIEYHEQALAIGREIGHRSGEGAWLGSLGSDYYSLGQVKKAIEYHEQALVIAREIGDRHGEGAWLGNLGSACNDLGQVEKAIKYYEQALAIAREIGDRHGEGTFLGNIGSACSALGQVEKAIVYNEQALVISREIGNRRNEGKWLGNLGNDYRALGGQVEKAIEYYKQALVIVREIEDRHSEGVWLYNLGTAYRALGQVEKAKEYLNQSLIIFEQIKSPSAETVRHLLKKLDSKLFSLFFRIHRKLSRKLFKL